MSPLIRYRDSSEQLRPGRSVVATAYPNMYFLFMKAPLAGSSPEQIMLPSALKGDPAAFYALFGPGALGVYLHLRQSGNDPERAQDTLSSLFARLYRDFSIDLPGTPHEWFETQCRRRLKIDGEIDFEPVQMANGPVSEQELERIGSWLQVLLHREYSSARTSRGKMHALRHSAAVVRRNPVLRILVFAAAAAVVVTGVESYLRLTGSSFFVSLDTRDFRAEFSMPVSSRSFRLVNAAFPDEGGINPVTRALPDSGMTADSPVGADLLPVAAAKKATRNPTVRATPSLAITARRDTVTARPSTDNLSGSAGENLPASTLPVRDTSTN